MAKRLRYQLYQVYWSALDWLFPPKCGGCGKIKKITLFNRSTGTSNGLTGNCKDCQREASKKSYSKSKFKKVHKERYKEHRDEQLRYAREYYEKNKTQILEKQKHYLTTDKGKESMTKAHSKRYKNLKNKGIPYKREHVLMRDNYKCYICQKPLLVTQFTGEDNDIHIDHIQPIVTGGIDCFTNVAACCVKCNLSRPKDGIDITVEEIKEFKKITNEFILKYTEEFPEDKFFNK